MNDDKTTPETSAEELPPLIEKKWRLFGVEYTFKMRPPGGPVRDAADPSLPEPDKKGKMSFLGNHFSFAFWKPDRLNSK